jgi:hypothetical protein
LRAPPLFYGTDTPLAGSVRLQLEFLRRALSTHSGREEEDGDARR